MSFNLGIVGLCTSHPEKWVSLIRQLTADERLDIVIRAVWDSGQVRPEGFARDFGRRHDIPHVVSDLADMLELVDGVIIHSIDWDRHVEQARPFVEAGKSLLIDKPLIGNRRDARQLLEWAAQSCRITGGSSLRFALEIQEYLARPAADRGELHTAIAGCGTDEFGYGIHAYSLLHGLMGSGATSVRHLSSANQTLAKVEFGDGRVGLVSVGGGAKLPFHVTAIATKSVTHITVDPRRLYRALLEKCLPYLTGRQEEPPLSMNVLLEPEFTALAALNSRSDQGVEFFLSELRDEDPGYDGPRYAAQYRLRS